MIGLCPYCGTKLDRPLKDGVAGCNCCNHIFDSSIFHELLSLRWMIKSFNLKTLDEIPPQNFSEKELEIIEKYIFPDPVSHEELLTILLKIGFDKYIT